MKKTGQPLVLTVNGKAAAVISDPDSYQEFLRLQQNDPNLELVPPSTRDSAGRK